MLSKKLTRDEFIRRLESRGRNDVEIVGEYIKSSEPSLFRCTRNECGYEWEVPPNRIMSGQGCPVCANKRLVVGVNSLSGALTKRAVSVSDENGVEIERFESQSEARRVLSQRYGKPFRHIVRSCQTGMRCGGLYFSYVSDVA